MDERRKVLRGEGGEGREGEERSGKRRERC